MDHLRMNLGKESNKEINIKIKSLINVKSNWGCDHWIGGEMIFTHTYYLGKYIGAKIINIGVQLFQCVVRQKAWHWGGRLWKMSTIMLIFWLQKSERTLIWFIEVKNTEHSLEKERKLDVFRFGHCNIKLSMKHTGEIIKHLETQVWCSRGNLELPMQILDSQRYIKVIKEIMDINEVLINK